MNKHTLPVINSFIICSKSSFVNPSHDFPDYTPLIFCTFFNTFIFSHKYINFFISDHYLPQKKRQKCNRFPIHTSAFSNITTSSILLCTFLPLLFPEKISSESSLTYPPSKHGILGKFLLLL